MDQFFTWGTLATLAGASLAVGILTQFFKDAIKIPTQWLSYIFAVIILAAATLFTGGGDAAVWAIIPLNAVIVSMSANGAYSAVLRVKDGKADSTTASERATAVAQPSAPVIGTVDPAPASGVPTGVDQAAEVKQDTALSGEVSVTSDTSGVK
jgi:hypothetical protein